MIEPYTAVALQTSVHNVRTRAEVDKNLRHIGNMIDLVVHICSLELPVRLIALGEGAIQGFIDEILDMEQAEYTDAMAADVPGWETEMLGEKAKQHGCFILAQLKTKHAKYPGRFFNTVFLIDPNGQVVYEHLKNIILFTEGSTTPHDVYDDWVAEHGDGIATFFPVAKTEIGNIAGSVGVEGAFPEAWRAFAMNGAEVLYHASLPEPWVSRGMFQLQNRARAMDNTCYMVAPNTGSLIVQGPPGEDATSIGGALGGRSGIYGYRGEMLAESTVVDDCYVAAQVNIEELRHYREHSRFQNWLPYLKTELFKDLYSQPIWPKNQPPLQHADKARVLADVTDELVQRGSLTRSKIAPDKE
ncbi:MAG: nitrilase-related carbon-nitrogen hydrolase [Gammaproteobacteria bacterium]|nr:nitrilase-related carbon-nitrogen hydrolase [Gammaproteobacteria bacterium]